MTLKFTHYSAMSSAVKEVSKQTKELKRSFEAGVNAQPAKGSQGKAKENKRTREKAAA